MRLPGSKSISNRVLLLAGLSAGTTEVHDLLDSDDTQVMLAALEQLGCRLERSGSVLRITGLGGRLQCTRPSSSSAMPARRCGRSRPRWRCWPPRKAATSRSPACRACTSGRSAIWSTRCASSAARSTAPAPRLPAAAPARPAGGTLRTAQPIRVRGDVSSQFLTALLLALPLVAADGEIVVEVEGELISKPYVEITLNLLARFGIAVRREGWQRFVISAGGAYRSPGRVHVEGDASSASYFVALGAIAGVDAPVRIEGVGTDSIQGDIRFIERGAGHGRRGSRAARLPRVRRGARPLKAITLDCNHIPDAAMTLAVMALFASGSTR